MKYLFLLSSTFALAQSVTTNYSTDLNGNRVAASTVVSGSGQKTEITQSINGRKVPREQSEERVIRDGPNGRVVETITKKFDQTGGLVSTERTVTEEEKLSDGSRSRAVTYRSDINGNMQEAERKTSESHKQGSNSNSQSEIARPDLNGGFQTIEKRSVAVESSGNGTHADETVYRRSQDGSFVPAVRNISDVSSSGSQTVEKSAHYEPRDSQALQLTAQTVSTTTKKADGSTSSEVNLYATSAEDGRVRDRQTAPQLKEQQTIERITGAGGSVTEVVSVRRPSPGEPSRLGPAMKISETVCTGKCTPEAKAK